MPGLWEFPARAAGRGVLCLGWTRTHLLTLLWKVGLQRGVRLGCPAPQTPSVLFPFNPAKGIHLSSGGTTGKSLADSQLRAPELHKRS